MTPKPHLLLILLLALAIQYAGAGWMDMHTGELWPAVILPAFQTVRGDTEEVSTLRPRMEVKTSEDSIITLTVSEWLRDLPYSHHSAFMRTFYCPASLCTHRATERGSSPESACWADQQLRRYVPDHELTKLSVIWEQVTYRPPGREPALVVPQDTFSVNLATCHSSVISGTQEN